MQIMDTDVTHHNDHHKERGEEMSMLFMEQWFIEANAMSRAKLSMCRNAPWHVHQVCF